MTPRRPPTTYGSEETTTLLNSSETDGSTTGSRTSPSADEESKIDLGSSSAYWKQLHWTPLQVLNVAVLVCSVLLWIGIRQEVRFGPLLLSHHKRSSTNSKYERVQGIGFQIYTGGARAFINVTHSDGSVTEKANSECKGLDSYGTMWTEEGDVLQCYIGNYDVEQDVQDRMRIKIGRAHV